MYLYLRLWPLSHTLHLYKAAFTQFIRTPLVADISTQTVTSKDQYQWPVQQSTWTMSTSKRCRIVACIGFFIQKQHSYHNINIIQLLGHVSTMVSTANKRLCFLKQLKRAAPQQLLHFYTAVIRPVLEYASPVWHYTINRTQSPALRIYTKMGLKYNF